jgi:uncharacterized alpha-E superfamily protein
LIGEVSRERLSADMVRLLDAPFPTKRLAARQGRIAAAPLFGARGLAGEHMARTDAWRFHDLGRRVERSSAAIRFLRTLAGRTRPATISPPCSISPTARSAIASVT